MGGSAVETSSAHAGARVAGGSGFSHGQYGLGLRRRRDSALPWIDIGGDFSGVAIDSADGGVCSLRRD